MKWYTIVNNIDVETGEVLDKETRNKYYTITKIKKNDTFTNYNKTKGYTTYTNECRRRPKQGILF